MQKGRIALGCSAVQAKHAALTFEIKNTESRREESGKVYWKTTYIGNYINIYCQRHYIFCNEYYSRRAV